jgi:hypothetical protein
LIEGNVLGVLTYLWGIVKGVLPFLTSDPVRAFVSQARFASPTDHAKVNRGGFNFSGTYLFFLKMKLGLFHRDGEYYWYHGPVEVDPRRRRWFKPVVVATEPGVPYTFVLVSMSEDWSILVDYYYAVHQEFAKQYGKDVWVPIRIPHGDAPGLIELDRTHVTTQ